MRNYVISFLTLLILLADGRVLSCPVCRRQVQATIDAPDYTANLFMMVLPLLLIIVVSLLFYYPAILKNRLFK